MNKTFQNSHFYSGAYVTFLKSTTFFKHILEKTTVSAAPSRYGVVTKVKNANRNMFPKIVVQFLNRHTFPNIVSDLPFF